MRHGSSSSSARQQKWEDAYSKYGQNLTLFERWTAAAATAAVAKKKQKRKTNLHDRNEVRELRGAVLAVAAEELQGSVLHEMDLRSHSIVPAEKQKQKSGGNN